MEINALTKNAPLIRLPMVVSEPRKEINKTRRTNKVSVALQYHVEKYNVIARLF